MPLASNSLWLMTFAALAAVKGLFEHLALLHVIQSTFAIQRISQVYRIRMCAVFAGLLVNYLVAPSLLGYLGLVPAVALIGALAFATGLAGLDLAGVLTFCRETEI